MDPQPVERSFRFHPRTECICGVSFGHSSKERVARNPWGDVRFLRCEACGSWCQSPQIDVDSLAAWYDSDSYQGSPGRSGGIYDNYEADEPQRLAEAQKRFDSDIKPVLPRHPADILEIGCASASLLAIARRGGHRVTGVDLSPRFAEQARRLNGIDVVVGDFLEVPLPERSFDAVILLGTVSNLPDLRRALDRIRRLVRDGGCVVLNFPDCRSWPAILYGRRFWMFAPSAITFASSEGFVRCAGRGNLVVQRMKMDWQQPSLRKIFKHSGLAKLLPARLNDSLASRSLPVRIPIPAVRIAWLRTG